MDTEKIQQISDGVIRDNELYTLPKFRSLLRLTESATRELRKLGLPVIRVGKRAFVLGRKAMEFFEQLGNEHRSKSQGGVSPD